MLELVRLREQYYNYIRDDDSEDKAKNTEKCMIKRKFKFENCKKLFRSN